MRASWAQDSSKSQDPRKGGKLLLQRCQFLSGRKRAEHRCSHSKSQFFCHIKCPQTGCRPYWEEKRASFRIYGAIVFWRLEARERSHNSKLLKHWRIMYVACVCDKGVSSRFSLSIAIQQTTLNQTEPALSHHLPYFLTRWFLVPVSSIVTVRW